MPGELAISGELSTDDVAHPDLLGQGGGGEILGGDGCQTEAEETEELHGVCAMIPGNHKNEEIWDIPVER